MLRNLGIPSSVNIFGRDIFYKIKFMSTEYYPIDINIENIPSHVTEDNCLWIGITKESVRKYYAKYPHKVSNQQESSIAQTPQQSTKQDSKVNSWNNEMIKILKFRICST